MEENKLKREKKKVSWPIIFPVLNLAFFGLLHFLTPPQGRASSLYPGTERHAGKAVIVPGESSPPTASRREGEEGEEGEGCMVVMEGEGSMEGVGERKGWKV